MGGNMKLFHSYVFVAFATTVFYGAELKAQESELGGVDEQLEQYYKMFSQFRSTLRKDYPRGEDRVEALKNWRELHSGWYAKLMEVKGPERILNSLEAEAAEKTLVVPEATKQVMRALRDIRQEYQGTGKIGEKIAEWKASNPDLIEKMEKERQISPVPEQGKYNTSDPTAEDAEVALMREELYLIRESLLEGGMGALKAAVRDPHSNYSKTKLKLNQEIQKLLKKQKDEAQ
ncbi:hypothetical protein Rhal01_03392 [Rubritalea halochordaticola]|uniref:Uncharacterized protein n=1 Tax=Rubritalea halochordaticola TaxID=714537 RepID=A0ABP9V5P1_9BACT